jgi:hypothetical protein
LPCFPAAHGLVVFFCPSSISIRANLFINPPFVFPNILPDCQIVVSEVLLDVILVHTRWTQRAMPRRPLAPTLIFLAWFLFDQHIHGFIAG